MKQLNLELENHRKWCATNDPAERVRLNAELSRMVDKDNKCRVKRKSQVQATSLAAYRSLENITELQDDIMRALAHRERTDRDLERLFHEFSPSSVRTRRAELVQKQLVRDSGKRERLPSGRMAIVWELV